MSDIEKVILLKDLFETYKNTLNLTTAETHDIEMWLEDKLLEAKVLDTKGGKE